MSDWDDEELDALISNTTHFKRGTIVKGSIDDGKLDNSLVSNTQCQDKTIDLGWDDWEDEDLDELVVSTNTCKKIKTVGSELVKGDRGETNPLNITTSQNNIKNIDLGWDDWEDEELDALVTTVPSKNDTVSIDCVWDEQEIDVLVKTNNTKFSKDNITSNNQPTIQLNSLTTKLPLNINQLTTPANLNKVLKSPDSIKSSVAQKLIDDVDLDIRLDSDDLEDGLDIDTEFLTSLIDELNHIPPSSITNTPLNGQSSYFNSTSQLNAAKPSWPGNSIKKPSLLPPASISSTTFQRKTIQSYLIHNQSKGPYIPPDDYYERRHEHLPLRYDTEAIENWIYPTNYPTRDYQFNIVHRALFENTLVSLPTGLGKTFIAAVVMFNFYKWFPKHKVIFTAPTRPLVSQQVEACFKICGIRLADSTELTGEDAPDSRVELWEKKRVFYLTPQILNNDLKRGLIKAADISCVVFDEAHRAQGAYAYVSVANELYKYNPLVRTLALSATPGRTIELVQSVVNNLRISRIESRSEESPDIKQYTFEKLIDKVVLEPSTMLEETSNKFKSLIIPCIKSLYNKKFIWTEDLDSISSFTLILARETFRKRGIDGWEAGVAEAHFGLSISFVRKLELLTKYGFTSFLASVRQWCEESKFNASKYRKQMLDNPVFNGIILSVEKYISEPSYLQEFKSHPKLEYLVGYLKKFFNFNESGSLNNQNNSKVMIFANFRDTVEEIKTTLSYLHPIVRPMSFIGQTNNLSGKGLAQKDQLQVISKFKNGEYNVLICTSIGEEGLDIGEVDLIVCYDCQSSPIRMLQRIGRTGRRRQGRVLTLLTKGSEEKSFYRSKELHAMVLRGLTSGEIELFPDNPRIIPEGITPTCLKMNIVTPTQHFIECNFPIPRSNASIELTSEEVHRFNHMFGTVIPNYPKINQSSLLTRPGPVFQVSHSRRTNMLIGVVKMIKSKGFNNVMYSKLLQQKRADAKNPSSSNIKRRIKTEEETLENSPIDNNNHINSQTTTFKKANIDVNNIGAGLKKIFAYHANFAKPTNSFKNMANITPSNDHRFSETLLPSTSKSTNHSKPGSPNLPQIKTESKSGPEPLINIPTSPFSYSNNVLPNTFNLGSNTFSEDKLTENNLHIDAKKFSRDRF